MPKEVIEIADTLAIPYGDETGETLQLPESLMEETKEELIKQGRQDVLMEEFEQVTGIQETATPPPAASLH